jgi:hypothetical protein
MKNDVFWARSATTWFDIKDDGFKILKMIISPRLRLCFP